LKETPEQENARLERELERDLELEPVTGMEDDDSSTRVPFAQNTTIPISRFGSISSSYLSFFLSFLLSSFLPLLSFFLSFFLSIYSVFLTSFLTVFFFLFS
jgi:VIT1/CCC1 family predicted Fe2+/Mn2+ transporter